jgi:hypothetical protein
MALSLGSLCLGVVTVTPPPFPPHRGSQPSLNTLHGRQRFSLVHVRSQSRVIGEVVAPVALLSGIALSPEVLVGTVGFHQKS